MKYSLLIPTFNEALVVEASVSLLVNSFRTCLLDWEIIIIDNGSTDGTASLVRKIDDKNVSVIVIEEKGKGRALREGYKRANGDIVGFTDIDLPISPEEIVNIFRQFSDPTIQVIIGSRFHKDSNMPGREWWRIGSSTIFNILARAILGVKTTDTQCPLKFMRNSLIPVFLSTKETGWFFDLEFISILERKLIPIIEVSVFWNEHRYPNRKSKLSTIRDGIRAVVAMFRIRRHFTENIITHH